MYKFEIQGCLSFLLIIAVIIFLTAKLWWVIVGLAVVAIVYYYARLTYLAVIQKNKEAEMNYEPKEGEVFKVCPFCGAKVKVSAPVCPRCNHPLN